MRARQERLLAMGMVLGLLTAIAAIATGAPFREAPPTTGAYRATAYTLRGGEWQIGTSVTISSGDFRPFTPPVTWTTRILWYVSDNLRIEYGITDHLQIGGYPLRYVEGLYNIDGKLRISLATGCDMALSLCLSYLGPLVKLLNRQASAVLSLEVGPRGGVHAGLLFTTCIGDEGVRWCLDPHLIADFDVLPNLKLVGELGIIRVSVGVGAWLRFLDFLDVKVALTPLGPSLTGGVYLRF